MKKFFILVNILCLVQSTRIEMIFKPIINTTHSKLHNKLDKCDVDKLLLYCNTLYEKNNAKLCFMYEGSYCIYNNCINPLKKLYEINKIN